MPRPPIKAQELAERLSDQIKSGALKPGRYLPSERAMADEHGVTRSVIRSAVRILADLGMVELREGSSPLVIGSGDTRQRQLDPAAVHEQLAAIRTELREMNDRLRALETVNDTEPGR